MAEINSWSKNSNILYERPSPLRNRLALARQNFFNAPNFSHVLSIIIFHLFHTSCSIVTSPIVLWAW